MADNRVPLRSLVDEGLLFEINRQVLHPLGLALTMVWNGEDSGEPDAVVLKTTSDAEGFLFSAEAFADGAGKFRDFMSRYGESRLKGRTAAIGLVRQTRSDQ